MLAVGILLGAMGCGDGARQAPIDAAVDAPVDADPKVKCQLPPDCPAAATPDCCVGYSPGGAFLGAQCLAHSNCVNFGAPTCDPNAAQPCTGSGVCMQYEFPQLVSQDHRKWWVCMCGNGPCLNLP